MPNSGRRMPEDRHFMHYVEQHVADSLDAAVSRAERWARALIAQGTPAQAMATYPAAGWFARQVLAELTSARYYVAQGEAHKAAWYALRLGEVIVEARLRGHFNGPEDPANGAVLAPIPPGPEDQPRAP